MWQSDYLLSNCQPSSEVVTGKLEVNEEQWIEGGLKITGEELRDQMQRLSESNHKNNFPHIMLLIEVRSLNYSLSIVYCEPISSSLFSVHLSISPHSTYLIFIFSPPPQEYTTANRTECSLLAKKNIKYKIMKMVSWFSFHNWLKASVRSITIKWLTALAEIHVTISLITLN